MEVELTPNAIPTMWANEGDTTPYTVQVLGFKHIKDSNYKITVSDGEHQLILLSNNKPEVKELMDEKKEAINNAIVTVETKSTPHPKNPNTKILFLQTLKVLQEGVAKIGEPKKYEPEDMAKASITSVGPHAQQEAASTSATTPQTVVKSEGKTQQSPTPKGPGLASPDNSPPKSENLSPLNMSQSADKCVPIAMLTMYQRPTIKGRITSKDPLREFPGRDGSTKKVFSIEISDESCDMKATFWDKAVDNFYNLLEVNKTYTFSKISLKMTNSKYNSTKCPYEMSVGEQSVIEVCDDMDAPKICFTFVGIEKLEEKINKNCDVIGVVQEVGSKGEIQLKKGGSKEKRNITVVDQSGKQVGITLWDHLADEILEASASSHDVVAFRSLRVGDYQGCSLNTTRSSIIQINPELPEAAALKEWYASGGDKAAFTSVSSGGAGGGGAAAPRKLISDIETEGLGTDANGKPSFFQLKCTIAYCSATADASPEGKKRAWCYPANPENKKKVVQSGAGWLDESTDKYMDTCQRRYISNLKFVDETGSIFMTVFDEDCAKLLGMSADELYELESKGNQAEFTDVWNKVLFSQQIIKVRAKSERWEEKDRVKCSVASMGPVNYADESKIMLERIRAYNL